MWHDGICTFNEEVGVAFSRQNNLRRMSAVPVQLGNANAKKRCFAMDSLSSLEHIADRAVTFSDSLQLVSEIINL